MDKESAEVTSAGRSFQTRAPATEKARRPTVASLTAGTHRSSEVEDQSLCRVGMLATGVKVLRGITVQCPVSLHCDLEHNPFRHSLLTSVVQNKASLLAFLNSGMLKFHWRLLHHKFRLPSQSFNNACSASNAVNVASEMFKFLVQN